MKRMKTFLIYALLLIGFWLFSNLLINVGINSTYKPIERLDDLSQIEVYQAEATLINGRIKGLIKNNAQNYKLDIVDEKGPEESLDIKLLPGDLTTGELFWGVLIVLMIMG